MLTVDAIGRSCPEPVLMTKQGLAESPEGITVLVDNAIAVENITRFAGNKGYKVAKTAENGVYTLEITR
ncbi:MAG: sulfurtransferase TusA family protein [Clostridia bacterium]|nr:sulfurtransferase TusA family protein [Clostridia bacterium]